MVNKQIMLALGATVVMGVFSLEAVAGSQLRINDSRGVAIEGSPQPAFVYGYFDPPGAPASGFVADVSLDGFLLCNYFSGEAPSSYEQIYLRPRHGAWLFGDTDSPGVTGSVPGVRSVAYDQEHLTVATCGADGAGTNCGGAGLQCYVASEKGMGVADLRNFFYDGFDALTDPQGSSVSIVVTHWPINSDDTFDYDVTVTLPVAGPQSMQSLPSSAYILKQGYDQTVFDGCTILLSGGQLIDESITLSQSCSMRPGLNPPTDIPVVSAALFTNPDIIERDYSDNVAFGYPVLTGQ